jgi:hypothetical protein
VHAVAAGRPADLEALLGECLRLLDIGAVERRQRSRQKRLRAQPVVLAMVRRQAL